MTLPSVLPVVVIVCCVVEVETKDNADVDAFPSVYVIPEANLRAILLSPAVASPILSVTAAVCASVPV